MEHQKKINDPMTFTEVLGRSEQGILRPFLCVAELAEYYVKAGIRRDQFQIADMRRGRSPEQKKLRS